MTITDIKPHQAAYDKFVECINACDGHTFESRSSWSAQQPDPNWSYICETTTGEGTMSVWAAGNRLDGTLKISIIKNLEMLSILLDEHKRLRLTIAGVAEWPKVKEMQFSESDLAPCIQELLNQSRGATPGEDFTFCAEPAPSMRM